MNLSSRFQFSRVWNGFEAISFSSFGRRQYSTQSWKAQSISNEFSLLNGGKMNSAPFRFIQPMLRHFWERMNDQSPTFENAQNFESPIPVQYLNELGSIIKKKHSESHHDSDTIWFDRLKFVDQDYIMANVKSEKLEEGFWYERHIFETSEIPTRFNNLHDFYGSLIWMTFPRTKRLFNILHNQNMLEKNNPLCKKRSPTQNFLTLFDECGVVVCIEENHFEELGSLLNGMEFKELFWNRRKLVEEKMLFINFGHSILEMLTMRPYVGYTTKFVVIPVSSKTFETIHSNITESPLKEISDIVESWNILDCLALDVFMNQSNGIVISDTKSLRPLPVLGIPQWWPNQNEQFYNNNQYFRKKTYH